MRLQQMSIVLGAIIFFSGCSVNMQEEANSALKMFNKDSAFEKALIYTKSSQIINSLETRAKITATYLNKIDSKYSDGEYFFIGVFIVNDDDDTKKSGLDNKSYQLVLNSLDKKSGANLQLTPEVVQILKNDDEFVRKMPHTESWSRYYIVKFPNQKSNSLSIEYKSEYGKAVLNFPKY